MVAVAEAVGAMPEATLEDVCTFTGYGPRTALPALKNLVVLGLVQHEPARACYCNAEPTVTRGVGRSAIEAGIRSRLIAFRPFEAMCEGRVDRRTSRRRLEKGGRASES